ncbi:pentatricopeptide repeat-containing protein At3g29230-like isoform X2 [Cucurbita moschata]|uniref:Pentatricopeptide repeat-containing protein At3g29230-like isoform X2 n=1 Tax=Cucurbita moschata TaxID=3662 RepID=A0A6J1GJB6_CUCMO|nr:pentatricopeptide repeat-containing protein At3g29230-like isoform X2 [Cucurbita moschata]
MVNGKSYAMRSSCINLEFINLSDLLQGRINSSRLRQIHGRVFRLLKHQDNLIATRLIGHYPYSVGIRVFNQLLRPNIFPCNAIIRVLAESNCSFLAFSIFKSLKRLSLSPNDFTFSFLLKAFHRSSHSPNVKQVHTHVMKMGYLGDSFISNALLGVYARGLKDMGSAHNMFDEMSEREMACCWTSLIAGYAHMGLAEKALLLFVMMIKENIQPEDDTMNGCPVEALTLFRLMLENPHCKPNHVTMVTVLSACAQIGDLQLGRRVHEALEHGGRRGIIASNKMLATALIDMYCKSGSLEKAKQVFHELICKDVISFNAMIMGLAVNGKADEALKLFSQMQESDIKPTTGTFIGLLSACSHSGFLEQGRQIFIQMATRYSTSPSLDHYACYIDLLARAGCVEDALEVVSTMPFEPNNFVWSSLLRGCLLHSRFELARYVSKKLVEVDPESSAGYVMQANSFATDLQWDDVSALRWFMREKGVHKQPGRSWISIDGTVHEFFSATKSHPCVDLLYSTLSELERQMKLVIP